MRVVYCRSFDQCLVSANIHLFPLQAIMIDICVMLFVIVRSYLPAEIRWSIALSVRECFCRGTLGLPVHQQVESDCCALKLEGRP